jgi:hypothetical protein
MVATSCYHSKLAWWARAPAVKHARVPLAVSHVPELLHFQGRQLLGVNSVSQMPEVPVRPRAK